MCNQPLNLSSCFSLLVSVILSLSFFLSVICFSFSYLWEWCAFALSRVFVWLFSFQASLDKRDSSLFRLLISSWIHFLICFQSTYNFVILMVCTVIVVWLSYHVHLHYMLLSFIYVHQKAYTVNLRWGEAEQLSTKHSNKIRRRKGIDSGCNTFVLAVCFIHELPLLLSSSRANFSTSVSSVEHLS